MLAADDTLNTPGKVDLAVLRYSLQRLLPEGRRGFCASGREKGEGEEVIARFALVALCLRSGREDFQLATDVGTGGLDLLLRSA